MKNLKKRTSAHGGARRGAGAKRGTTQRRTLEKKLALDVWRERVEAELQPLITAQLELAKGAVEMFAKVEGGIYARVTDHEQMLALLNDGDGFKLLAKEPDGRMLIDIMNRLTGKPKEQLELTGQGGGPVQVRFVDA